MKNLRQWAVQIGALTNLLVAVLALVVAAPLHADQPWRQVVMPTVAEAAASFARPPAEYAAIHWAIWGGQQTKARIIADIDRVHANGGGVYMINNSRGVKPTYLSPEYMDLVKTVVQQCKKNGMKVWIEGDCGYPDGFAGGLISKDYPQLGMQGIIPDCALHGRRRPDARYSLPADTLGILASPRGGAEARPAASQGKSMPLPADGKFKYTVPRRGGGEIIVQLPDAEVRYNVWPGEPFAIPRATRHEGHLPQRRRGRRVAGGGATWRRRSGGGRSGHGRAAAR